MPKFPHSLLLAGLLLLSSCYSAEQLSIDYMLPADISFPSTLKRVAVVNNMPNIPDNRLILSEENPSKKENEVARTTNYYNGDAAITTEALAEALAAENYFEEVVVCDSALRSKDITSREGTLTQQEVIELTQSLSVDFLIALENVQMRAVRKISRIPDLSNYLLGTTDVKVYPTVKVYLPNRKGAMVTVSSNDSIFWETQGTTEGYVRNYLISDEEMLRQASEFAGTVPVKHLLPYWKSGTRYLFSGGSVNMRDAAIYAQKGDWTEAIKLWQQTYATQKGKKKMYAAYNTALGYEMQDNIEDALAWALKAQAVIHEKELTDYLFFINLYVDELNKRKEGMARLNMQMDRFNE